MYYMYNIICIIFTYDLWKAILCHNYDYIIIFKKYLPEMEKEKDYL